MKLAIYLILLLLSMPIQAILEVTTQANGTGLVIMEGPGNFSFLGAGEQNVSLEWKLDESDFEERI